MLNTDPLERPRVPITLRLRILEEIAKKPEISGLEIIRNLIKEDPGYVIFFYTKNAGETLTLKDQLEIYSCENVIEKRRLLKKLFRNRQQEYSIDTALITRTKTWYNKSPDKSKYGAIYGSPGLGYVIEKDMNGNRAARWMKPRLRKLHSECLAFKFCAKTISVSADSPERRKVSKLISAYVGKSMVYHEIKAATDGLDLEFIKRR